MKEMCSSKTHKLGAGIVLMKLDELHSFEGHPFKVERNQELFELRCSVEKEGIRIKTIATVIWLQIQRVMRMEESCIIPEKIWIV